MTVAGPNEAAIAPRTGPALTTHRRGRRAGLLRRLGPSSLTIADQIVWSASNAALTFAVANRQPVDFAPFSVCFVVLTLIMGLSRALNSDLFVVRQRGPGGSDPAGRRSAVQVAVTRAAVLGVLTAPLLALTGVWQDALAIGVVLAVLAPAVLVQDVLRYVALAGGRPGGALALDLAWVVVLIGAGTMSVGTVPLIVAWGLGAAIPAGLLLARTGPRRPEAGVHHLRGDLRTTWPFVVEFATAAASVPVVTVILAALSDDTEVAAFRGALTVMGIAATLMTGVISFVFTQLGGSTGITARRLTGAVGVVAAIGAGGAVALATSPVGRWLLGDIWLEAAPLMPHTVAYVTLGTMGTTIVYGLRALGLGSLTTRAAAVGGACHVAAGSLGAVLGEAPGVGFALAVSFAVRLGWLVLLARRHVDRP